MRLLIIIVLGMFLSLEVNAQTSTASLYITLTDIQSVKIPETNTNEEGQQNFVADSSNPVQLLSPAASQIKKYDSHTSDISKLNREFYSGENRHSSVHMYAANNHSASARQSARAGNRNMQAQLIVYQIDPR